MTKSPDAFRTISEVADWLGIQAHVLRFWESKFSHVKPVKRAGGRRYYRPSDMQLIGGIKHLLYEDGLTIKGVQKVLREQGVSYVANLSPSLTETAETIARAPDAEAPPAVISAPEPAAPQQPEPRPAPVETTEQPEDPVQADDDVAPPETEISPEEPDEPPQVAETGQEELPLPEFIHRRAAPDMTEQAESEASAAQPAEASGTAPPDDSVTPDPEIAPIVVEAPDPPEESDMPYSPGILADLSACDSLDASQVAAARPLIGALDAWLGKVSGAA